MPTPFTPAAERFWAKVQKGAPHDCWHWQASKDDKGYGMFKMNGRMEKAHRAAWRILFGGTGGMGVLHRCDNPACVNPAHLFLGTHSDNMKDCAAKGRLNSQSRR